MSSFEDVSEALQQINTVVATLASFFTYGYIIRRILSNHATLTQYQHLLVGQASVYMIGTALRLVRVTLQMGVLYGYPFIHNRLWVTTLFLCLLAIAESAEAIMLMIIVHIITLILVSAIGPGIVYLCVALSVDVKLIVTIVSSYMVIVYMLFAWYPVIIGFIIKWSISGFLTTRKGQITTIVVDRTTTPKPIKH
ncbi:unnamed protein product [Nippostrongylus brasiliensis]|uniref:TLC domain-containing protein n=1 Tax=Nippostrongylus brasiliensis TaxID=27835 RepID=A0A0N4YFZ1_NIPBR|nr:unnamed protein product [Nippostrongylus brasiliensis]